MRWHEMSRDAVVETLQTSMWGRSAGEAWRADSADVVGLMDSIQVARGDLSKGANAS